MLARSAFAVEGVESILRLAPEEEGEDPDWGVVDGGRADLAFLLQPDFHSRRLEDRVLDVLRLACGATTLEGIEEEQIHLPQAPERPPADELLIVSHLIGDRLC